MSAIRTLAPDLACKIAAGEVVERPASVVKELVENAIDAGARRIAVDIEDGGRSLIRVADDGHGIAPSDAALIFTAHSTSKISSAADLFRIRTLGFRGEALSSLASVARVRLTSRPKSELSGIEVTCEGGLKEAPRPSASPEGTVLEARDLFYNVPARRKFLKGAAIEADHVREAVRRIALSHAGVAFVLTRDGHTDLALAPAPDLRTRAAALFEESLAADWIAIERSAGPFHLSGLAAPPRHSRTSPTGVYLFVNGRFVRDRVMLRAAQDGYRDFLVSGRQPVVCLFLQAPADRVDVNVHPAKAEVRFADPSAVYQLVHTALRQALGGAASLAPAIRAEEMVPPIEERIVSFFSRPPAGNVLLDAPIPRLQAEERYFQLHHRYLIQEIEDGILVIDQHALHERCLLEKLRRSYRSADMARQKLLMPAVVELTDEEISLLELHRRLLESVGVEWEEFGRRAVRITAVPALLGQDAPEAILRDFAELCRERPPEEGESLPIEHVLEMMACRSAVRFGRSLPREEIEALLADRELLANPHSCAHGRPVAVKLSLDELDRFFKRK
jgi:DNA mismatch repair protein MutL